MDLGSVYNSVCRTREKKVLGGRRAKYGWVGEKFQKRGCAD